MKIKFCGAAKTVTGSKHLLELKDGRKVLLDCGLYQGRKDNFEINKNFPFSPNEIDMVVLSHAHIDHSGLLPRLVKMGFSGKIWCTPATADLCGIMLKDSAYIQEQDTEFVNKFRRAKGKELVEPLYTIEDAEKTLELLEVIPYKEWTEIAEGIKVMFTDAGHILGSATVNLKIKEHGKTKRLCFTGDIGRYKKRILKQPQEFPQADIIISEATYGDRLHEPEKDIKERLLRVIYETCVAKKGKLLIPAFSVGRTQDIVYLMNVLEFEGKLPSIKVYVDSPLAVDATAIYRKHKDCYNSKLLKYLEEDPTPFGFKDLTYINDVNDSKALNSSHEPCIIISASGMMVGGRIKHHLKNNILDNTTTILFIGYCDPSTLGGKVLRKDAFVKIFGEEYPLKANVESIDYFSAHADYNEIIQFLSCQDKQQVEKVFLVHGDNDSLSSLKDKLYQNGFYNVVIPEFQEEFHV